MARGLRWKRSTKAPQGRTARSGKPGSHQTTEDILYFQIHATGLPLPIRQHLFAAPQRKFRADFCWLARRLIVEVEGQVHSIRARREADIERRQWCHFAGWTVIAVSAKQVRSGEALRVVERLLKP